MTNKTNWISFLVAAAGGAGAVVAFRGEGAAVAVFGATVGTLAAPYDSAHDVYHADCQGYRHSGELQYVI